MKKIKLIIAVAVWSVLTVSAQEKKIKFSSGTLKICSSKTFQIEGYDGNEVIIKSLHDSKHQHYVLNKIKRSNKLTSTKPVQVYSIARGKSNNVFFSTTDKSKREGLKRLGKKQENKELGIYFTIEQKNGELIFSDNTKGQLTWYGNEKYLIKIPNSIKLKWYTNGCKEKEILSRNYVYFNSKASSLSNFDGEVELSTSLNNFKLTDVTGPVSINSIGGNVTVQFDKKTPRKLYSVYTNNGFIDITLPSASNINVEAKGAAIYSDLNFNILEDTEKDGLQQMKLKLKKGNVKMKLKAGYGTIYLRKKK
ncbi:MAG: hypothetical protein HWD85_06965 [Flavobacteriaceae bacterium]|nr:hypothetical protein [Flavobacteriaceae bacterium]